MKNALVLHGADNNSRGNWFPWLKTELEKNGWQVWSPDLPNAHRPARNEWLSVVFSRNDWKFDKDSIIVGHSSGATFILRILEQLPTPVKIDKAILVAGFIERGTLPQLYQYKDGLLDKPFDWKKIKNSCNRFCFIASDNDTYQCGEDQAKTLHAHLGGELVIQPGQGHFNLEAGKQYRKFPFLLDLLTNTSNTK